MFIIFFVVMKGKENFILEFLVIVDIDFNLNYLRRVKSKFVYIVIVF